MRFESDRAECWVWTFKEGVLSKVAHDLQLRATQFWVEIGGSGVRAEFDARSWVVDGAVEGGTLAPSVLSEKDKQKIIRNLQEDVLDSQRFPTVTFESDVFNLQADALELRGRLRLRGQEREIRVETQVQDGRVLARVVLNQLDYGITPFRAMMGALKVKPEVRVQLSVPDWRLE